MVIHRRDARDCCVAKNAFKIKVTARIFDVDLAHKRCVRKLGHSASARRLLCACSEWSGERSERSVAANKIL